jgi:hypothetical protein
MTGCYCSYWAAEVRRSSGYRSFTTYPSLFEPFLPVLASTIAKYPKSIQWENLGNATVTRSSYEWPASRCGWRHTECSYPPHRITWPEATNQFSICLLASVASWKTIFLLPVSDVPDAWQNHVWQEVCQPSTNSPHHTPG